MRYIAKKRHLDDVHIKRKAKIIRDVYRDKTWYEEMVLTEPHRLSKGKVHCSCPLCAFHCTTRQEVREFEKRDTEGYDALMTKRNRQKKRSRALNR